MPDQPRPSLPRAVAVLSITQIIGWGTTFFTPGVLAGPVGRELGLSREFVFSGVSVMLLVAAAASPAIGRMVDRRGARGVMAAGSLVAAAANLALSFAAGPWSWLAGWVLVGLVLPLALASAAFAALAQIAGRDARRAITMVTLFTGVSGSIFWPLTALLEVAIGWRATYGAFAALNLLVCLPLHLWGVPHGAVPRGAGGKPASGPAWPEAPPPRRRAAFVALALATSAQGFVGWGLSLHVPALLEASGLAAAPALALASLTGPAQIAARAADLLAARRFHPVAMGLGALAAAPPAFLLLLADNSLAAAIGFILLNGVSNGMMTVARATMPLALFGPSGYGAMLGRLALPQNLMFAAAPVVFAAVLTRFGAPGALWLGFAVAVIACGALAWLARSAGVPLTAGAIPPPQTPASGTGSTSSGPA